MSWNRKTCRGRWGERSGELMIGNIKEVKRGSCLRFDYRVETKGNKVCSIDFYLHNAEHHAYHINTPLLQEIKAKNYGGVWQKGSVTIPPALRGGNPQDIEVSC